MSFLIDTNVISEVRKGARCDAQVAAWFGVVRDADLFLSVLVIGEIRKGIELARRTDPAKAGALETWLAKLLAQFADRVLPIDRAVGEEWGRMSARRPLPVIDGLLAATAKIYDLTLVTRDAEALAELGAEILNPFEPRAT